MVYMCSVDNFDLEMLLILNVIVLNSVLSSAMLRISWAYNSKPTGVLRTSNSFDKTVYYRCLELDSWSQISYDPSSDL